MTCRPSRRSAIARASSSSSSRSTLPELAEHREIVAGPQPISRMCALGGGCASRRISVGDDLAPRTVPPVALVELGHLLVDDALHQRKTSWRLSSEGRERSDEDRRDQRPPGRAVQRPGQHPGENLVEEEAGEPARAGT